MDDIDEIYAPKLDWFIDVVKGHPSVKAPVIIESANRLLREFEVIRTSGGDELREIWIELDRGGIAEFGDYDEYYGAGEVGTLAEFEEMWKSYYPDETRWYLLSSTVYREIKALYLNGEPVLEIGRDDDWDMSPSYDGIEDFCLPIIDGLICALRRSVARLKEGVYNDHVEKNLPFRKRIGRIQRSDYWHISPGTKEWHLGDFSSEESQIFVGYVDHNKGEALSPHLSEMTAELFFTCCSLGYKANKYLGIDDMTPADQYKKFADGRHDGLLDIETKSADAFREWYLDKSNRGGHPWEVCGGGNSTHISLYVRTDESGWWLSLAGASEGRSVETIRFYNALMAAGLPVELSYAEELSLMIRGLDDIGIVPEDVFPRYCHSLFPEEDIISYMNLPYEPESEVNEIIAAAYWYPPDKASLADSETEIGK